MQKEQEMPRFSPQPSDTWYTLLCVGMGAALAGFSAAFLALNTHFTMPSDKEFFYVAAALASLLIGPLFWWLFIIKPHRITLRRGIIIGMLGSVVAHPLTWFLAELMVYSTGRSTWMGSTLVNPPLVALFGSLVYSVFSLVYVGWFTTLLGAIAGGVLIYAQRTCTRCHWISSSS